MSGRKKLHVRTTQTIGLYRVDRVINALELTHPGEVVSKKDLAEWARLLNVDVIATTGRGKEGA